MHNEHPIVEDEGPESAGTGGFGWLLIILLVAAMFFLRHREEIVEWFEQRGEDGIDWIFWVIIAIGWLAPLVKRLLDRMREKSAQEAGEATPVDAAGAAPAPADNRPIVPR